MNHNSNKLNKDKSSLVMSRESFLVWEIVLETPQNGLLFRLYDQYRRILQSCSLRRQIFAVFETGTTSGLSQILRIVARRRP